MDSNHFTGRVAIVTGVAHGIGSAIVSELRQRGATVYGCDVRPGDWHQVDVSDEAQVNGLAQAVLQREGRIDILVNVAGGVLGQKHKPLETVTRADWQAILDVNLTGAFLTTRAVAPAMKAQRRGSIVNISSGAGRSVSLTGIHAYTSAKAGLIGFTRQCARELGNWNIRVNCVAPGFVPSNPSSIKQWEEMGEAGQKALLEAIALHRLGTPEEIAWATLFFLSDYAAYVTGQVLSVDGGRQMF